MEFNIRVYGLLINELNQVLVSDEYLKGLYITKFPGGGLEFKEGTKDCLIREFKEETGLDIEVGDHFYTTDFYQISYYNPNHQIISIYYFVHCKNLDGLEVKTEPFQFPPDTKFDKHTMTEVFRFIDIKTLNPEVFGFGIDKTVAERLRNNWI